jgi:hypothetical protein
VLDRATQDVPDVQHGLRRQAAGEQFVLQVLDVIGVEVGDAHAAEPGLEVQANDVAVTRERGRAVAAERPRLEARKPAIEEDVQRVAAGVERDALAAIQAQLVQLLLNVAWVLP